MGLPEIRVVDVFDVVIVAALVYWIYRLIKGTNVMPIFWALIILLVVWRVADMLRMRLLGEILGAITSVGLIALVVIFQPEIRKFLLFLGTKTQIDQSMWKRLQFWRRNIRNQGGVNYEPYVNACMHMSQTKTGALIIFRRQNEVEELVETGERINAPSSSALIETIFFKNSPLHDGAMVIRRKRICAAGCILPVSHTVNIPKELGLRHRAALGISQESDALAIICSEETGRISVAMHGEFQLRLSAEQLESLLSKEILL